MEQSLGATSGRLCIMYQFVGLFNVHMSWFECFERFEFSFWFMMLCFIRMFRSEFCSSNVLCYFVFTFPSVTLWRCFNFIQFSLEFSFFMLLSLFVSVFWALSLSCVSCESLPCPLCVFPQSFLCLVSLPPCLVSHNCFHVSLFVCPSFVSAVVLCPFAFLPPAPPSRSMFPHPGLVFRVLCLVFSFSSCSLVC